jgi:prefoldin subunit 5
MFKKKVTTPADSKQPESQPAEAAMLHVGLIGRLESELAAERAALEQLVTRAMVLKENIAVATGRNAGADVLVQVSADKAAKAELEKAIGKKEQVVMILGTQLDLERHRAKQLRATVDRLTADLPSEYATLRLETCAEELKDLVHAFPTMRDVSPQLSNVWPVVHGLVKSIKAKRMLLEKAKLDLLELEGGTE